MWVFSAFEYPSGDHDAHESFWYDILDGLPEPERIVDNSMVKVIETPGLGVVFNAKARGYLAEEDRDFLDPLPANPGAGTPGGTRTGARL